jgi:hypothetical protein
MTNINLIILHLSLRSPINVPTWLFVALGSGQHREPLPFSGPAAASRQQSGVSQSASSQPQQAPQIPST